jgi:transposase
MGYVTYAPKIKALALKLHTQDQMSIPDINDMMETNISERSFQRWAALYRQTMSVVQDPALYKQRGAPLKISVEEREFLMDILSGNPTLYLDEIQTCLAAQSGNDVCRATIHCELLLRLNLTTKVARTVHPAQCPIKRAIYTGQVANIPAHFLVFTGMSV